jgi:hypothetical protein
LSTINFIFETIVFCSVLCTISLLCVFLCSTDISFLILISLPWSSQGPPSERMTFSHSVLRISCTILVLKIMQKVRILTEVKIFFYVNVTHYLKFHFGLCVLSQFIETAEFQKFVFSHQVYIRNRNHIL